MANSTLAQAAVAALTDDNLAPDLTGDPGVKQKGYCSRFVRRVVRKVYGLKYDHLFGASAIHSGKAFRSHGFTTTSTAASSLKEGDILFKMKGSGGFGHVGILAKSNGAWVVVENSSVHRGPNGAKGTRTLSAYGAFQLVGRLPAPVVTPPPPDPQPLEPAVTPSVSWYLNGVRRGVLPVKGGTSFCPVAEWADALGFELDWDEDAETVLLGGKPLVNDDGLILASSKSPDRSKVWLLDGQSYVSIRLLAKNAGLLAEYDKEGARVLVSRP